MRIEKINDNQIRCTLNQKDLSDRELRISELAYGSERARSLFRDMMQQASYEFGFEAEDIPLMIEAIPMYPDTLVLVITKVDDPEELDTRFSHFTEDDSDINNMDDTFSFDGDVPGIDLFGFDNSDDEDEPHADGLITATPPTENTSRETDFISLSEALGMEHRPKTKDYTASHDVIKIFVFGKLQELGSLAEHLVYLYHGKNTVYKDEKHDCFYLVLHKTEHTPEEFSKICNIVSEYGKPVRNMYASHSFYEEHFEPLIRDKALQVLASL
jgi:adapter protein MecA 1/2